MMLTVQALVHEESRPGAQANRNLPAVGNNGALRPRTMAFGCDAGADRAINPRGRENGKAGTRWQKTKPGLSTFIIAFSQQKRARHGFARAILQRACGCVECLGLYLAYP